MDKVSSLLLSEPDLETRSVFAYNVKDESISLDGRHFVKNVPAKILGKILSEYSKTGRQEFEYREFKMDSGFSCTSTLRSNTTSMRRLFTRARDS